jgi:hypothetical protein
MTGRESGGGGGAEYDVEGPGQSLLSRSCLAAAQLRV